MRLRHIELTAWRCFVHATRVGPFADGINVVHAPNGTGKSTLFAALRRAMLDAHRTGGAEVQALASWGRDLAPRVAVEFDYDGVSYRIEKQFLKGASSLLSRFEDGRHAPLMDGEAADARVRAMLLAEAAKRGLARDAEHLGLADVLWVPQGRLAIDDLAQPLAEHVRAALGAESVGGAAGTALERKIEAAYGAIFTPTGAYRGGADAPAVVTLGREIAQLREDRVALAEAVQAFDDASRRVEERRALRDHADRVAAEARAALAGLREAAARYERLDALRRVADADEGRRRAEHEQLSARVGAIRAARDALAIAIAERERHAALEPAVRSARAAAQSLHDAAAAALATLRAGREAVAAAVDEAERAARFVTADAAAIALAARHGRLREADATLARTAAERDRLRAPTPAAIAKLRRAEQARREARAALDASMITLRVTPEAGATLDARVAERPGPIDVAAGRETIVRGSPEVVLHIPGFGEIRASGPATSADAMRRTLDQAAVALAELTAPYGTDDLDELQRRADADVALAARMAVASAGRAAILAEGGGADAAAIERDHVRHAAARDALLAAHPAWRNAPPDAPALREIADERRRAHERSLDAAARDADAAGERRRVADAAATEHAATAAGLARRVTDAEAALAMLAHDGDDASRASAVAEAARAWEAAAARHAEARAAIEAFDEPPAVALARRQRELEALEADSARAQADEQIATGRLRQLADGGAYSRLADVDERIARVEADLQRATAHAAAIRLLRDTVVAARARLIRAVAGPVETVASDLLRRIAGSRLGLVRLGERFGLSDIVSPVAGNPVDIAALSGGEQEQVHLAVRLALADVLARQRPQMVVLDDVLIATDAGRLGRVRAVLEESAARLQIVILTCHPERYRGLRDANFIDLDALRNASPVR